MELNREQIVKALECLTGEEVFCRDCGYNRAIVGALPCRKELAKDAIALIRELTEENAKLRFDVSSYKLERERNDCRSADLVAELAKEAETNLKLTEEIERLKERVDATAKQCGLIMLESDERDFERLKQIAQAKADTVRKMQEAVLDMFPSDKDYTTISRGTVKRIAKEVLGENK